MNVVFNMDCMEEMKEMKDNQFDLAIVDPPYGIGADAKNSTEIQYKKSAALRRSYGNQNWDNSIPDGKYFLELSRVSKDQIIWGANYFGLKGGFIYWDKLVDMPTYSDGELAFCSLLNSVKKFTYRWNGMLQGDMKNKENKIHPTQKPVKLYEWLLKNYAKEGDTILDTHLGSGSSRIAAYNLGFDFTGYELDKDYYEDQEKRFKNHIAQKRIFDTPKQLAIQEAMNFEEK